MANGIIEEAMRRYARNGGNNGGYSQYVGGVKKLGGTNIATSAEYSKIQPKLQESQKERDVKDYVKSIFPQLSDEEYGKWRTEGKRLTLQLDPNQRNPALMKKQKNQTF